MRIDDHRLYIDAWSMSVELWFLGVLGLLVGVGFLVGVLGWLRASWAFLVVPVIGVFWMSTVPSDSLASIGIMAIAVGVTFSLYLGVALGVLARAVVRRSKGLPTSVES